MDLPIAQILSEINAISLTDDQTIIALATELAEGVTDVEETEIVAQLPIPYTRVESATAELGEEKIRVPRMVLSTVTWTPSTGWITSETGRRMRKPKADCAVGSHVLVDNEHAVAARVVILWRRPVVS